MIIFWCSVNCMVKIKPSMSMLATLHYCFCYLLYGQNLTEKYIVIILIEAIITHLKHSQNETDKSLS